MAKERYLPSDDDGKTFWLITFAARLPIYAAKYNIIAGDITDMTDSNEYWDFWITYRKQCEEYQAKLTAFKNELRSGVKPGGTASVLPAPPVLGTSPTAVAPGIFVRPPLSATVLKRIIITPLPMDRIWGWKALNRNLT